MRRGINVNKHTKYLENAQNIIDKLPSDATLSLTKKLEELNGTFCKFYKHIEAARKLSKEYDALQSELTKAIRHSVIIAKQEGAYLK